MIWFLTYILCYSNSHTNKVEAISMLEEIEILTNFLICNHAHFLSLFGNCSHLTTHIINDKQLSNDK